MTVYRLCIDLGLNLGNVYSYLHGDDVTKVSRATARRILDRARSFSTQTQEDRIFHL